MDPKVIEKLAESAWSEGLYFDTLILFWLGEPLMHPRFNDIYTRLLDYNAKKPWFNKVEVHTNALPLGPAQRRAAVINQDVPAKWHISLDAVTRDTYRAIKGVDRLEEAEANTIKLLETRGKEKWPAIVFQMVVQDENAGEALKFAHRWKSIDEKKGRSCSTRGYTVPPDGNDYVFLRQLDALEPEDQAGADELYFKVCAEQGIPGPERTIKKIQGSRVCSGPWKSPTIGADGRMTVCTRDSSFELEVGKFEKSSNLAAAWWFGEKIETLRKAHLDGRKELPSLCRACPIPRSSNYTSISGSEIAWYRAWKTTLGK